MDLPVVRLLGGVVAAALLAACTTATSERPRPAWTRVALPGDAQPSLVVAGQDASVLVAVDGDADGEPRPRLFRIDPGGVVEVPVRSTTYYARRAVWGGLAVGPELHAFGGRSGGAHGNTRWSAWSGRPGLREEPQDFETFGGPRAGGLAGIAVTRDGHAVLVGSRVSARGAGLDVALWEHVGRHWVRRDSTGTALATGAGGQPAAHGVVGRGKGLLVVGSLTEYDAPRPRTRPAVWTSQSAAGPWTRQVLAGAGQPVSEADAAACDGSGACLVVGVDGDHLVGWRVSPAGETTDAGLPRIQVDPAHVLVAATPTGWSVAVATPAGRSRALATDEDGWTDVPAPPGTVVGWAAVRDRTWAVTQEDDRSEVWRTG